MSDEEEREALMHRMETASSSHEVHEVESALEEARDWLRHHPGDDRVAAAMQRLEERDERLRDPESAVGWKGLAASAAVFCVVAFAVWGAIYGLTGRWTVSIIAGVILGLEVTWWTWEITMAYVEDRMRNRSDG